MVLHPAPVLLGDTNEDLHSNTDDAGDGIHTVQGNGMISILSVFSTENAKYRLRSEVMTDLIKREDAIKAVSEPFDRKYWQYTTMSIRDTVKALKDILGINEVIDSVSLSGFVAPEAEDSASEDLSVTAEADKGYALKYVTWYVLCAVAVSITSVISSTE